uniref:Uncharacterized protein n=1 Tax=Populus trichocarpa TaxID=3694 RepID=B9N0V7_POPTR
MRVLVSTLCTKDSTCSEDLVLACVCSCVHIWPVPGLFFQIFQAGIVLGDGSWMTCCTFFYVLYPS